MGCVEMDGCPHRARPVTPALRVVNSGMPFGQPLPGGLYPTTILPSGRIAPLLRARLIAMAKAREIGPTRPMNIVKLKTNFEIQFKVGVKLAVRPTVPNAEVASKRASIALIGWSFVARITPVAKKATNIETVVMDKAR